MLGCETEKRILLSTTLQIAHTDLNFATQTETYHCASRCRVGSCIALTSWNGFDCSAEWSWSESFKRERTEKVVLVAEWGDGVRGG